MSRVSRPSARNLLEVYEAPSDLLVSAMKVTKYAETLIVTGLWILVSLVRVFHNSLSRILASRSH